MNILEIVKLLLQDSVLVENWTKFYFELGLPGSGYVQLEQRYRSGTLNSFELFFKILTIWESGQNGKTTTLQLCNLLDGLDFKMVADRLRNAKVSNPEQLENDFKDARTITWPIRFGFIETNGNFYGRSAEMDQLAKAFQTSSQFQMFLISGLGGIGKTELAKNFATVMFQEKHTCTFLNGDTSANFRNNLLSLAEKLHLNLTELSAKSTSRIFEDVANLIIKNLHSSKWLLVLDNLDEENEEVSSIFEILSETTGVFVLGTSRNRSILGTDVLLLSLDSLNLKDAKTLVCSMLGYGDEERNAIFELCQTLQNYPLALRQAVGYIKEQQRDSLLGAKFGVNTYLQKYKKESEILLGYQLSKFSDKYEKTTLLTWSVTISKIRRHGIGTIAIDLLNILAYLSPNGISVRLVQTMCKKMFHGIPLHTDAEQALVILKKYSFIHVENMVIQIHRLVQQVTQISLKSQELEVTHLQKLVMAVIESKREVKVEDFPSLVKILEYVQKYDELRAKFMFVPTIISNLMIAQGMYKESLSFSRENYDWLKEKYGDTNDQLLQLKKNIARGLRLTGSLEEALQTIVEVRKIMETNLGKDNKAILQAGHTHARILTDLGRYDEALSVCDDVIESQRFFYVMTPHIRATVLIKLKRYDEALNALEQVLSWLSIDGEDNWETLTTLHSISTCHYLQKNYTQAKDILERVVTLRSKSLGALHPDTLLAKYDLAMVLCCLEEKEKGLTMLIEVWKAQSTFLGEEDFRTKLTMEQIERISLLIQNKSKKSLTPC